jgi:hypothetical protein
VHDQKKSSTQVEDFFLGYPPSQLPSLRLR